MNYSKKGIERHKSLVMSAENEIRFQWSSKCYICNKLFDVGDHCHKTGKYRGFAHWICNINLKLTKKVPLIFHNSKGYCSHLILQEIGKFDMLYPID